ncbi:hypothetical protein PspLS_05920 [Pyricularia sp. CBS 133598]|nr:hypothetical protein PspLS_05920 [Pyricularia sp. CBS 133598]
MNEVMGGLSKNQKRMYPGMISTMRYEDYIYFGSSVKGGEQDLISPCPPPKFIANSPGYWMASSGDSISGAAHAPR